MSPVAIKLIVIPISIALILLLVGVGVDLMMKRRFSATGLIAGIVLSIFGLLGAWSAETMLQLVELDEKVDFTAVISKIDNSLVRRYAEEAKQDYCKQFEEFANGTVHFNSESAMMRVYYELFRDEGAKAVSATSMVSVAHVWEDERGKKALAANREAIEKGCAVERVFIPETGSILMAEGFQEHLAKQAEAGVSVFYVVATDLEPELRKDFLVTDTGLLLEYKVDTGGYLAEAILSANSDMVNKYRSYFNRIKDAATQWKKKR